MGLLHLVFLGYVVFVYLVVATHGLAHQQPSHLSSKFKVCFSGARLYQHALACFSVLYSSYTHCYFFSGGSPTHTGSRTPTLGFTRRPYLRSVVVRRCVLLPPPLVLVWSYRLLLAWSHLGRVALSAPTLGPCCVSWFLPFSNFFG